MQTTAQKLTVRSPGEPPVDYVMGETPVVIGRDASCDVRVPSQYVSRRHIQIEWHGDGLLLTDLGGRNPVLLNGEAISGSANLLPGDSIAIADVIIDLEGDGMGGGTVVFSAPKPATAAPATPIPGTDSGLRSVWRGQNLGPGGTLTIMFTDLERSTNMVTELGEREAYQVLKMHNGILREQFAHFRGHEAKRQGDGFLVLFASARDALNCAVAIQRQIVQAAAVASGPIRVRMGLHIGEVLWDENDIFGSAVNFAARVSAAAEGGEILVSALLREVIAPSGEFAFEPGKVVPLKGFKGEHELTPLRWRD
ncbi:MAG: FHA domain-containing protein [Chloroflexi bacterium]|nr:FHA domain-containing protein [Chloroflexota bacterium]